MLYCKHLKETPDFCENKLPLTLACIIDSYWTLQTQDILDPRH